MDLHPAGPSSVDLLKRLSADSDQQAWAALHRVAAPEIHRVALRITGNAMLADDATQDCMLHLRDHAGSWRPPVQGDAEAAARGWIRRVAASISQNLMRGYRRAQARDRAHGVEQASRPGAAAPDEKLQRDETRMVVRRALADLSETNRQAVARHYLDGLPLEALADELEVPIETAKKRVQRGLHALRRRLELAGYTCSLTLLCEALQGAESAPPVAAPATAMAVGWGKLTGLLALVLAAGASLWLVVAPHRGARAPTVAAAAAIAAPIATSSSALPRVEAADEWLAEGELAPMRRGDAAEFPLDAARALRAHPAGGDALGYVRGFLRHRRQWPLDGGPVSLRLRVEVPPRARLLIDIGAAFPDAGEPDWRRWSKLHLLYDGIGGVLMGNGPSLSTARGCLMTFAQRQIDRTAAELPLLGGSLVLTPGSHRLEVVVWRTGCRTLADGRTLYEVADAGPIPAAQFYVGVTVPGTADADEALRVDGIAVGPAEVPPQTMPR